jgi:hypothetical protein
MEFITHFASQLFADRQDRSDSAIESPDLTDLHDAVSASNEIVNR